LQFCRDLAAVAARNNLSDKVLTEVVAAHSYSEGVFAENVKKHIPTDAKRVYELACGDISPIMHQFKACRRCGRLKRTDNLEVLCDGDGEHVWDFRVQILDIEDWLRKMYSIPIIAELMTYEDEREVIENVAADVYDKDVWQRHVRQDEVFNGDSRHAKFALFMDAFLLNKENPGGPSIHAWILSLFNLPPHLRWVLGLALPLFIGCPLKNPGDGKWTSLPTFKYVQEVVVDMLRHLYYVGVEVYDAYKGANFLLRGRLISNIVDSRALLKGMGRREPGCKEGASMVRELEGVTLLDLTKPQKRDGSYYRLSKVVYPYLWRGLPLGGRFTTLRRAAATLNRRGGEYGVVGAHADDNTINSVEAPAWTETELRNAVVFRRLIDQGTIDRSIVAELKAEAMRRGFDESFPIWDAMPSVRDGVMYEFMHAAGNCVKTIREAILFAGPMVDKSAAASARWESLVNGRHSDLAALYAGNVNPDSKELQNAAGFCMNGAEEDLCSRRGHAAAGCGFLNSEFKGSEVLRVMDRKPGNWAPLHVKTSDLIKFAGPIAKWQLDGLMQRTFKVDAYEGRYDKAYFAVFDALNACRRKTSPKGSGFALREQLVEAISLFYLAAPTVFFRHAIHQLIELAMRHPVWPEAAFGGERALGVTRGMDMNPREAGGTIAKRAQALTGATLDFFRRQGEEKHAVAPIAMLRDVVLKDVTGRLALPATFHTVGKSMAIVPNHRCMRTELFLGENPGLEVSLVSYYLQETLWSEEQAPLLHELYQNFLQDGGEDLFNANGEAEKLAIWRDFQSYAEPSQANKHCDKPWYGPRNARNIDREVANLTFLRGDVTLVHRCGIGGYDMRSIEMDNRQDIKSTASYFLARVDTGEGGFHYEIGRATGFLLHHPPDSACGYGNNPMVFVRTKWLLTTLPALLEASRLPITVLDNMQHRYRTDIDVEDGFITHYGPHTRSCQCQFAWLRWTPCTACRKELKLPHVNVAS
jgi:hypothetical protein